MIIQILVLNHYMDILLLFSLSPLHHDDDDDELRYTKVGVMSQPYIVQGEQCVVQSHDSYCEIMVIL